MTGVPFVDANMRELRLTGWMSNRGRQNVASFLTKDLGLDWRLGAEWFESQLVSMGGRGRGRERGCLSSACSVCAVAH